MIRKNKKVMAVEEIISEYQVQIRKLQEQISKSKNMPEAGRKETQRLIDEYTIKIEILNVSIYNHNDNTVDPVIDGDKKIMDTRTRLQRYLEVYMQEYFPKEEQKEKAQAFYAEMCKEIKEDLDDRSTTLEM